MSAFAGIALIWIFRVDAAPIPQLPSMLLISAVFFFALGLTCDLLQYITATITWGCFHRYHEKKLKKPTKDPKRSHDTSPKISVLFSFSRDLSGSQPVVEKRREPGLLDKNYPVFGQNFPIVMSRLKCRI